MAEIATENLPDGLNLPSDCGLLQGRFAGRLAFAEVVRAAFAVAAQHGWRELLLSDVDFADWPIGECAVVRSLHDWARSGRQLTLIAATYDEVRRRHPRFTAWRQTWSHLVTCRIVRKSGLGELPSAIWSPQWALRRLDPVWSCGVAGSEPARRALLRERLMAHLHNSAPGFAPTALGL